MRAQLLAAAIALATGGFGDAEFKMMDSDHDAKISAAEHEAGAKKMWSMMDKDNDGIVTASEMTDAQAAMPARARPATEMSAAETIRVIDTNKDGVLSAQEHVDGSKLMFSKMDTDKDGFLSKAELEAGMAMKQKKS